MKEEISSSNITKPSEFKHNNDNYAFVDDSQIRGGLKIVNNITERNAIPYDKRGYGVVKYRNSTDNTGSWVIKTYESSDLLDSEWQLESNWINVVTGNNSTDYELVSNKTSLITDDNKTSVTLYPSISAITTALSDIYTKSEVDAIVVNNKGYYATSALLVAAWPTGTAGYYALVGETDTIWVWDSSLSTPAWIDSDQKGQVSSVIVNGTSYTGDVTIPLSSSSYTGLVKPDSSTIEVDSSGTISVPILLSSKSNSIYVSTNGQSSGTGSVANPYNRIYKAIDYVIGTGTRSNPQHQNVIIDIDGDFTITDPTLSEVDFTLYSVKYNIHGKITYSPTDATTTSERYLFNLSSASNSSIYVYGEGTIAPTGTYCSFAKVYGYINCNHYVLCNVTVVNSVLPNILKVYGSVNNTNENFITGNNTLSNNQASGLLICENLYSYNDYLGLTIPPTTILINGASNVLDHGYTLTNKYPTTTTINESNRRFAFYLSACNQVFINNPKIFISGNNSFICHDSYYGGSLNISGCLVSGYKILTNTSFFRCMRGIYNGSDSINKYQGAWLHDVVMQSGYSSANVSDLFGSSTDIIKIESSVTSILNFVVHNCIFQNSLNATALSWIGKQYSGDKAPSINVLGSNMYVNNIPTSALPDSSYVIVVDSTGKSQKVLASEIKTPGVVVSDTFYTAQTTVANFIANDSQASTITKSNLLSLSDGTLYVLVSTDGLTESNYKQITTVVSWSSITSKPSFATVATSADYTDLINKPDLSVYALIADQDGGATVVLTANTDILSVLRAYIAALDLDSTTRLIQRSISFVVGSYTATFGTYSFTGDISLRLSCRLSSGAYLAVGDMQVLNSSFQSPTTYEVTITSSAYSVDRLAKYSEITSSGWTTSKLHQLHLKPGATVPCTNSGATIGMASSHSRNWPTNGIAPCSGYIKISGAVTWHASGGTSFAFSLNLLINSTSISLSTDYPPSSTGKDKTTVILGYYPVSVGDSISLVGTTTSNTAIVQTSTNVVYEIVED